MQTQEASRASQVNKQKVERPKQDAFQRQLDKQSAEYKTEKAGSGKGLSKVKDNDVSSADMEGKRAKPLQHEEKTSESSNAIQPTHNSDSESTEELAEAGNELEVTFPLMDFEAIVGAEQTVVAIDSKLTSPDSSESLLRGLSSEETEALMAVSVLSSPVAELAVAPQPALVNGVRGKSLSGVLPSFASDEASLVVSNSTVSNATASPSLLQLSNTVLQTGQGEALSGFLNTSLMGEGLLDSKMLNLNLSPKEEFALPPLASERPAALGSSSQSVASTRFGIDVQFGRAEWQSNMAERVVKMAAQNVRFAEIQLDPPELGQLQVKVQLNQEQASVSFIAASSQVRESLEQNSQRLREMFQAEGMELVNVDVSDQQQPSEEELESKGDGKSLAQSEQEESDLPLEEVITQSLTLSAGVDEVV